MTDTIKGLGFPFKITHLGHLDKKTSVEKIKANIYFILRTSVGDRPLDPVFGTTSFASLFRAAGTTATPVIKDAIIRALTRYETRIVVRGVAVSFLDDGKVEAVISFSVKGFSNYDDVSISWST